MKQSFCEPCHYGKIENITTCFGKTCEVPEPLCEICSQQHTRHKETRGHEICYDMDQLYKHQKKANLK